MFGWIQREKKGESKKKYLSKKTRGGGGGGDFPNSIPVHCIFSVWAFKIANYLTINFPLASFFSSFAFISLIINYMYTYEKRGVGVQTLGFPIFIQ